MKKHVESSLPVRLRVISSNRQYPQRTHKGRELQARSVALVIRVIRVIRVMRIIRVLRVVS